VQRARCRVQGADDVQRSAFSVERFGEHVERCTLQRIEERPENKLRLTIKTEDELEDDNNNRLNAR
jgi:hypothetical protein